MPINRSLKLSTKGIKRLLLVGRIGLGFIILAIVILAFTAIYSKMRSTDLGAFSQPYQNTVGQSGRFFTISGTAIMPSANGFLVIATATNQIDVRLSGLKRIGDTDIFELWLVRMRRHTIITSHGIALLRPTSDGRVVQDLPEPPAVGHYDRIILTLEHTTDATRPTPPIMAEGKISG